MTTTMPERETLPPVECAPIVCAPWCEYQDGHPNQTSPEDQRCYGPELRSPASYYPAVKSTFPDDRYAPAHFTVYAAKKPCVAPWVELGRGDEPPLRMTSDEARQLVENLQLVLGQIEAAR